MTDYTLVEQMLPARVLTEIGIYLQSAAHLELTIWQIIMYADGEFLPEKEKLINYLEIKKVTPTLLKEIKSSVSKVPPKLGIRLAELAKKLEVGLINRNYAAHGAFFLDPPTMSLRASHYYPQGKGSNRTWYEASGSLNRRQVSNAIEEIDALLREAVEIRIELEKSR